MKKLFSFFVLFFLIFSFTNVYAKEQPKTVVTEKQENYKMINDTTKTISEEDEKQTTNELNQIFKNIKETTGKDIKIYTFIYDSPAKSTAEAEREILTKHNLDNTVNPIIFIYNKADKTYKFIIDERINTFISYPYVQALTNQYLVQSDLNAQNLQIVLIRLSSTTGMAIRNDLTNISDKTGVADAKNFSTYDFETVKLNKNKEVVSEKSQLPQEGKSNEALYMGIALLLALISIFVVVYKKRKR